MPHQTIESDPEEKMGTVLGFLTEAHPSLLHVDEVIREMATDPAVFADRDDVTVAIQDLARVGLAHRHGEFVFASRAAVRADELRL